MHSDFDAGSGDLFSTTDEIEILCCKINRIKNVAEAQKVVSKMRASGKNRAMLVVHGAHMHRPDLFAARLCLERNKELIEHESAFSGYRISRVSMRTDPIFLERGARNDIIHFSIDRKQKEVGAYEGVPRKARSTGDIIDFNIRENGSQVIVFWLGLNAYEIELLEDLAALARTIECTNEVVLIFIVSVYDSESNIESIRECDALTLGCIRDYEEIGFGDFRRWIADVVRGNLEVSIRLGESAGDAIFGEVEELLSEGSQPLETIKRAVHKSVSRL
ncbi:MAG: hypothetical protein AAGC57_20005 [Pseudomonadota bacterium]